MDVSVPEHPLCDQPSTANISPSWYASYLVQGAALAQQEDDIVDWWFGLYRGIDQLHGNVITPNPVQCTFRDYPLDLPGGLLECLGIVYLSVIQNNGVAASEQ